MAPADKKTDKKSDKPASSGSGFDFVELVIIFLVGASLFGTIVPALISYVSSGEISFYGLKLSSFLNFFRSHSFFFKFLGLSLAGLAAYGTFIFNKKADLIWREEKLKLYPEGLSLSSNTNSKPVKNSMTEKWQKILEKSESDNPSDWRLCIIEADIMLDDLLQTLNLPGDTIGEKLKAVEKSDFNTIEYAWEAHKARNMIAHEGSDFLLNQREVRRIISLYEAVFKEFFLI